MRANVHASGLILALAAITFVSTYISRHVVAPLWLIHLNKLSFSIPGRPIALSSWAALSLALECDSSTLIYYRRSWDMVRGAAALGTM
jgi:hypothetical protein